MATPKEINDEIVDEFNHLLDKSKQLFNGLRDLPQHGHTRWQNYFGRTFDVYTKLWRFQQQHRAVLDRVYGLKRWQIGEIASKIGQLYYHYYLRTSDIYYLNEAFSFFAAIRARDYYCKASREEQPDLMVKKLRYYARFIIACLLLKRLKLVRELYKELQVQIEEYRDIYDPDDYDEWDMILTEIHDFLDADSICSLVERDSPIPSRRMKPATCPPFEKIVSNPLKLSEILVVGNCYAQIRFSELSMDMYRIMQTLEHDSLSQNGVGQLAAGTRASSTTSVEKTNGSVQPPAAPGSQRTSPHKYLLFKPTYSEFVTFLAAGFKDLDQSSVLLLYISADGHRTADSKNALTGFESGGVVTNCRCEKEYAVKSRKQNCKEIHCIYPADIYPYARKPLFFIVDSDNSHAFKNFQSVFGQPVVCLLSPRAVPSFLEEFRQKGNIYTLFLHCPLTAFSLITQAAGMKARDWEKAQGLLDEFFVECLRMLCRSRNLDQAYVQFMSDEFLRLLILRHCFAVMVLQLHKQFRGSQFYPSSSPPMPESELMENRLLHKRLMEISVCFDSRNLFASPDDFSIEKFVAEC